MNRLDIRKTYLITGGAGFIGFHLSKSLLEKGAEVIGWAGVDGIHCCFVKGFGEMVFAVNPSNLPGDHVHPLARSFEDFVL